MLTKTLKITGPIALSLALTCSLALATDYSSMSTEELSQIRGTLYNASQEERDAFRTEWQGRYQQMSPEQRQQYAGPGLASGNGPRDGTSPGPGPAGGISNGNQKGTGNGSGSGGGRGKGQGNGRGRR